MTSEDLIVPSSCTVGQPYAANYNDSYASSGLAGHTGTDVSCGFGSTILFPFKSGFVYKVLTAAHPSNDGSGFTGVFILVDDGIDSFEYLVGHCDPLVAEGTNVSFGDALGTESNHGTVFSGNIQITLAMQKAGDQRGHHRHEQKRPFIKTRFTVLGERYLDRYSDNAAGSTYRDDQGFYYQIINYNNGFHGCVDLMQPVFKRDLFFGRSGYDVYVLQRFLVKNGYGSFEPTAFYGFKTQSAVSAYQKAVSINPFAGYFGPKTRAAVLKNLETTTG